MAAVRAGDATYAGWQVTLCDWHVGSHSSVVTCTSSTTLLALMPYDARQSVCPSVCDGSALAHYS